jgi:hypothetical protein
MKGHTVYVLLHEHQRDNPQPGVFATRPDAAAFAGKLVRAWAEDRGNGGVLALLDRGRLREALDEWSALQEDEPPGSAEHISIFEETVR